MFKRIGLVIFVFLMFINLSYSTQVDVSAYVYKDYTIFNYVLKFDANDTQNKFSLQKPIDAELNYVVDQNGAVEYDVAGDYFIFKPENVENGVFLLKYKSEFTSSEIFRTDSFRTYLDFNFDIDKLKFTLLVKDDFGEIIDAFPRNYSQNEDKDKFIWEIENVTSETLVVVNFRDSTLGTVPFYKKNQFYGLFLLILLILVGLYFIKKEKSSKSSKKKEKVSVKVKEERVESKNDIETNEPDNIEEPGETLEDFIEKHLTDNEKEVVLLIKDHEGISQYDILNHLPKLTKSNLSKIISKLHARKVLKRIKVGKVNKIYLGEKFEKKEE